MPGILCEHCTAVCCRYIALPIDPPDTPAEFEDVRWFLLHESVSIFIEDDDWYIAFHTPCRHLQADHRCGIYDTRPKICRSYTTNDCDYHSGDYNWQHHFTTAEHLDAYVREHASNGRARRSRTGRGCARMRRYLPSRNGHEHDRSGIPLPMLIGGRRMPGDG